MARRKGPSLTRAQVIDAAIRCVEADGPDALGVSRVARELGIQPPSIYNHVGKGDALPWALLVEGNRRMFGALRASVRDVFDPRDQLLSMALGLRAWARDNPGLYALMSRIPPDNEHPDFKPLLLDILELFERPLAQLGVQGPEALHAIRGMRAATHGFLLLEISGQFALSADSDQSFIRMIHALLRGIDTRSP